MHRRTFCSLVALSLALIILASAAVAAVAQEQHTVVVTSTANDGPGSLREAILNARPGTVITFDPSVFPPDDPAIILIHNEPLPPITQGQVTIDGSNAGVILDGSELPGGDGISVQSDGNVIKGLQILSFPNSGVAILEASGNLIGGINATPGGACSGECNLISGNETGLGIGGNGSTHNTVSGNYIGTNLAGTAPIRNANNGVWIGEGATHTLIGGDTASERNLISGNSVSGVRIDGRDTTDNVVSGNYIGSDATGTMAVGNALHGVDIGYGAQRNRVGGNAAGERNLISGNGAHGAWIGDSGTAGNVVSGNYIGTNSSGTAALPNGGFGIDLSPSAQDNLVGGSTAAQRNLISGNGSGGVNVGGSGVTGNVISGNYIGTDAGGTAAVGNMGCGIEISGGAQGNRIGGNNATPGGACTGECNLISGNRRDGVWIGDSANNTVSGNYIGSDVDGTTAIGNGASGLVMDLGASHNVVGGSAPEERNVISGNHNGGINVARAGTTFNAIIGNYIGTTSSGTAALRNESDGLGGVNLNSGASDNTVGPGNVIAFNSAPGIWVRGDGAPGTARNTLTQNAVYDNADKAIDVSLEDDDELPAPHITYVGSLAVRGTAPPYSTVEIFSDDQGDAQFYEGDTAADEAGAFVFLVPEDGLRGQSVTATATDQEGNTSELSEPARTTQSIALKSLPKIPTPSEISLEPQVVGLNLGLALVSVLFFGATTTVFNSILETYASEIAEALDRVLPRRLRERLRARTLTSRGQLLRTWLAILIGTAAIESFLDPGPLLSVGRVSVLLTLLVAAMVTGGLQTGSDLMARRRLAPGTAFQYQTQWIGLLIASGCVILSRAMGFQPGYLYGAVGLITLLPELTDTAKAGKRALIVLLVVLGSGLVAWLLSPLLASLSADLEALSLTLFATSLQGVYFALLPFSVTEGGDIWSWRKWVWVGLTVGVSLIFYHVILNPWFSGVKALQQNSVQTILILYAIFATATLALWLLFPFRLRQVRKK